MLVSSGRDVSVVGTGCQCCQDVVSVSSGHGVGVMDVVLASSGGGISVGIVRRQGALSWPFACGLLLRSKGLKDMTCVGWFGDNLSCLTSGVSS